MVNKANIKSDEKSLFTNLNNRNPIFITNKNGEFIEVNEHFCQEVGCAKNNILGTNTEKAGFLTENTREKIKRRRMSKLIGKEAIIQNFDVVTKKGDILSLEIKAIPYLKDGELSGESSIVRRTSVLIPDKLEKEIPKKPIRKPEKRKLESKIRTKEKNVTKIKPGMKQEELESINKELETRNVIIAEIKKQLTENQMGLLEKTSFANRLQTEVQKQQQEIQTKNEELRTVRLKINEKTKDFNKIQKELSIRHRELFEKNVEITQLRNNFGEMKKEVDASKSALNWFKIELDKKKDELQSINAELETRNDIIGEIQRQLTEKQTVLIDKTKNITLIQTELGTTKQELLEKAKEITGLQNELKSTRSEIQKVKTDRDQLSLFLSDISNSIPSSVLMIDKDNVVTGCNKKAEEMLGLKTGTFGTKLFQIKSMDKERLHEGLEKCVKDKKPASIKSFPLKNKQGEISLVNISNVPILGSNKEFRGALMIIHDISELVEMEGELKKKQADLESLESRLQEVHTQHKLVDGERNVSDNDLRMIKTELVQKHEELLHVGDVLEEKQRKIDLLDESIKTKNVELGNLNKELEKSLSNLKMVGTGVGEKAETLGELPESKLRLDDEIDKSLGLTGENLKTKKIDEENEL